MANKVIIDNDIHGWRKENEHDEKQEKNDIEDMSMDELRKALGLKGH